MLRCETWDVFTTTAYAGNPLAVVHDPEAALTTAQMQAIAREFNLSETIFVLPPRTPDEDAQVRIFHPSAEMPFAGHPTVGCAIALSTARGGVDRLVLGTAAGPAEVTLTEGGSGLTAEVEIPALPRRAGPDPDVAAVAAAIGLGVDRIGQPGLRPVHWAGGPDFVMIPVCDRDALAAARVSQPGFGALRDGTIRGSCYVFAPGEGAAQFQARMFALGGYEDPATGSASAILAGVLHAAGLIPEGVTDLPLRQGIEMGRPSDILIRATVRDGALVRVTIAGQAVMVTQGKLASPPT